MPIKRKKTLKEGSVVYVHSQQTNKHYYVVVVNKFLEDNCVGVMINSLPSYRHIKVTPDDLSFLEKDSYVNCDNVHSLSKHISEDCIVGEVSKDLFKQVKAMYNDFVS